LPEELLYHHRLHLLKYRPVHCLHLLKYRPVVHRLHLLSEELHLLSEELHLLSKIKELLPHYRLKQQLPFEPFNVLLQVTCIFLSPWMGHTFTKVVA
jgi:hypothetical protein